MSLPKKPGFAGRSADQIADILMETGSMDARDTAGGGGGRAARLGQRARPSTPHSRLGARGLAAQPTEPPHSNRTLTMRVRGCRCQRPRAWGGSGAASAPVTTAPLHTATAACRPAGGRLPCQGLLQTTARHGLSTTSAKPRRPAAHRGHRRPRVRCPIIAPRGRPTTRPRPPRWRRRRRERALGLRRPAHTPSPPRARLTTPCRLLQAWGPRQTGRRT